MNKTLKVLAISPLAAILFSYPATIQADTTAAHAASVASGDSTTVISTAPAPVAIADTKTVWVTAYTSDPDETSDHPLITASGGMVHDGVVADNQLPFGTQIEIPALFGDKVFTVEDRTSAKFSGRVDIWMPTYSQAVDFGIQHAQIVVLGASGQDIAMQ